SSATAGYPEPPSAGEAGPRPLALRLKRVIIDKRANLGNHEVPINDASGPTHTASDSSRRPEERLSSVRRLAPLRGAGVVALGRHPVAPFRPRDIRRQRRLRF